MIRVETLKNFAGFGEGGRPGEYYYSQGMRRTLNGLCPSWQILKSKDTSDISVLTYPLIWLSQAAVSSNSYSFGMDESGYIYRALSGVNAEVYYRSKYDTSLASNGMITDQKGRLIYISWRYIGMCTMAADYTTGTVQVTQGSNAVVGTGTNWSNATMAGKRFKIAGSNVFYTVSSVTDATHLTLTANYAEASESGKSYTIYTAWTDDWKDLGSDQLYLKPAETYEDWILIGYGNKIAGINTTDDSFNAEVFALPTGFTIVSIKANKNGVLIGATFQNRSILLLWDAFSDRSIAPWLWLNDEIKSIDNYNQDWVVVTARGIYITDGYSLRPLKTAMLDASLDSATINVRPQGAVVINNKLLFWGINHVYARNKGGLYILDLLTELYEFVPVSTYNTYISNGVIGVYSNNGNFRIILSYSTDFPGNTVIGTLFRAVPSKAIYIDRAGQGENLKTAEAIKLTLAANFENTTASPITFTVSVKIANFMRSLRYTVAQKVTATEYDKITINASDNYPNVQAQIGDEITVLQGANSGEIRHITAISGEGTNTEIWTLDSPLPNLTEANANIDLAPFKLVDTFELTDLSELEDLFFNIQDKMQGKHFLIKIVFENLLYPVEIQGMDFIYDDQNVL